MSFVVYIAVLLAGLVSVMLGLQLASAPPPARTATQPQLVEPIRHPATPPAAKSASPAVTAGSESLPAPVSQQPAVPVPTAEGQSGSQTTAQSPHESTVPGCNISACETHYPKSFRAADCTYQPNYGPRKLCRK
jgi:hypothetical protein